jgi:Mrp family chromosome partitioning ATPase
MGRIFEALQKADGVCTPHTPAAPEAATQPKPVAQSPEPDADDFDADGGASFIEVGPNRSMEASPDVLASAPGPVVPPAPVRPVRTPVDEQPRLTGLDDDRDALEAESRSAPPETSVAFRSPPVTPVHEAPSARPGPPAELVVFHCPEAPASARYAELLKTLLARRDANHPTALFFTAARHRVGTTTVLLNLAFTAARRDRCRVAVVDANLHRPGIAAKLLLAESPGLRDILAGTFTLDAAIQETEAIDLFALTAGSGGTDTGLRIVGATMRSLVRELRRRFQLILIDGPRWDGRPEVVAAGVACDSIYVVTPEAEAESPHVDQLLQVIPEQGGRLGGCVLSDVLV